MAARLISAAEALRERAGVAITLELRSELDEAAAAARSALGNDAFCAAASGGGTIPLAHITGEALAWVKSLALSSGDSRTQTTHPTPPPAAPNRLSSREVEVLRLIADGKSNREIAAALVISLNTVARHVSNIFDKVGAVNRTEAAAYAHRHRLGT